MARSAIIRKILIMAAAAYLLDEHNTMENRTHLAIWTLGQIRSEKALPVLKNLYRDDPDGNP
jgi:hypothetical protein